MPTLSEIQAKVDLNRAETIQLAGSIFALVNALVRVWQPNQSWQVKEPTKGPDNILYTALLAHSGSSTPPASDTVNWKVLDLNAEAVAAAEAQTAAEAAQAAAETAETNAQTAETNAAASATAAAASATAAAGSATTAASEATDAAASATAAASSETSAAATLVSFQNIYLGEAASDPTTRPDASALQGGEIYYNTGTNALRLYSGSAWQDAAFDPSGALVGSNNLSDLVNAATARGNLGLGTAAVEAASAFLASTGGTVSGTVGVQDAVTITNGSAGTEPELRFVNTDFNAGTGFLIELADAGNLFFRDKDNLIHFRIDQQSQIAYAYYDFDVAGVLSVDSYYKAASHTLTGTTPVIDPNNGEDQEIVLSGATTPTRANFVNGAGIVLSVDDGTGQSLDLSSVVDEWIGDAPVLKASGRSQVAIYQQFGTVYGRVIEDDLT